MKTKKMIHSTDRIFSALAALSILVLSSASAAAAPMRDRVTVRSPDGRNGIELKTDTLEYAVTRDGVTVVEPSAIDLKVAGKWLGASAKGAAPVRRSRALSGTVPSPVYKKSQVDLAACETFVDYGDWGLRLVARNDGVAYRFETSFGGRVAVQDERADVNLPESDGRCWAQLTGAFGYEETVPVGLAQNDFRTATGSWDNIAYLPFAYESHGTCVAVVESDVRDYPVWNLCRDGTNGPVRLKARFAGWPAKTHRAGDGDRRKPLEKGGRWIDVEWFSDRLVETEGTRTFPWRAFVLADEPSKFCEADLVWALARAPDPSWDFSWVKPGLVAWDWWCDWKLGNVDFKAGCNTRTYEAFVDFAARNRIPYVIMDDGWAEKLDVWNIKPTVDVRHVIRYAAERGVGVILWIAWPQAYGDEERVAEHFAKMGAKGFKVDFMDRSDADVERFLWRFAEACRKHRLVVDYHGVHHPAGLNRTYPNVLNFEGVHGLEMLKVFRGEDMPANDVRAAYLRMTVGPLDYTPGAMDNYPVAAYRGTFKNPGSMGTRVHQLALYTAFEAPLQMLCDSPTKYDANSVCRDFIATSPTVWDDTVALGGTPDSYFALARRAKDGVWHVAAVNDSTAREIRVKLDFLKEGAWVADVFRDAPDSATAPTNFVRETRFVRAGDALAFACAPGGGFALRLRVRNDWENPEVNSVNRLPPRTYSMPLKDVAAALTDDLEPETPYRKSLNGTWRFSWAGNPDLRAKDFWKTDFDDREWSKIDVPSCVECRGWGNPIYVNQEYPHANTSDPRNAGADFARILDFETRKPDYNPVSSYRTTFTVPADWNSRDVILRFDGVYSACNVWVNGKKVGYAEDSCLPSEFNITPYLNPIDNSNNQTTKQSNNSLAVEVFRWSDGSFLEDQDMFRFSGIFRDVTLWAMPKGGVWDFVVNTVPVEGYEKWKIEVKVEEEVEKRGGGGQRTDISLYDAEHKEIGNLTPLSTSTYFLHLSSPRLWSAEDPYLYTLVIKRGDDIRMKRVGFKEQKVVGNKVLVNGRAIKFHGVNRHEHSPDNGRSVTLEEMVRDVTLMKRFNIDTVRTSHYPAHHSWYDLCDRYGLYLVAEANVEGHGAGFGEDAVGCTPEWADSIVERNVSHVVNYRNHPSVVFFSAGNETAHGEGFHRALKEMKRLSPAHPTIWECGNRDADVDAKMYPSLEWLETCGRYGEGKVEKVPLRYKGDPDNLTAKKPFFLVEYAHAMGNAMGNFQRYWDVFEAHPSLLGGCIWDWIDQALWQYGDRVDPATGRRERRLAYGGGWDEWPNNQNFCCNGVIGPERKVSAKLVEVGHVHRPLVITRHADGSLELRNRMGFTFADAFNGVVRLRRNGEVVASVPLAVPHLAPLERCALTPPAFPDVALTEKDEWLVDFEFALKAETPWAKKGWIVARDQLAWHGSWGFVDARHSPPLVAAKVVESADAVTVTAGSTRAVFSRATGTLCELTMDGKTILRDPADGIAAGPRFSCTRATTDNDLWIDRLWRWHEPCKDGGFTSLGLSCPNYHAGSIRVEGSRVTVMVKMTGSKSGGFAHESVYDFRADGSIALQNTVTPFGTVPKALPRMGLSLRLDPSLERVAYYGRGPYENYVDRCTGSFLGVWRSTVTEMFEFYVRPQDNGYRGEVRWVSFVDADGRGVRISGSEPLFVQALHYTWEDLARAGRCDTQTRLRSPLVPRPEVCLNLDVRQVGLGNGSCGPDPLPEYIFPVGPLAWSVLIEPL